LQQVAAKGERMLKTMIGICVLAMLGCGSGRSDKADGKRASMDREDDDRPRKRDRRDDESRDDDEPRKRRDEPRDDDPPVRVDRDEPRDGMCRGADDCPNIVCRCEDGKSINARQCNNGECVGELATCTDVCDKHDGRKGTWDDGNGKKTGARCRADAECASTQCFEGYCTRSCSSFGDCPPFWDCEDRRCKKR
jgi:hypothetical protein